ncbi:TPA: hypothetical protein HA241_04170 [Candidatus Woesearchaeota archaeon]|nr:hypothetical protein [Candidatus Woesearchaeota archaeon]
MVAVLSIEERIAQSRKASAVERAWNIAKALERDRKEIEGLTWIEPQRVEGRGISRRVDFSREFPEGVTYLTPVPLDVSVIAPASKLVPGENLDVAWSMPILTRMTRYEKNLDSQVKAAMGLHSETPTIRYRIEAVSFLPFPKADASIDETFIPEFAVTINVEYDLGKPDNYYAVVAKYGGKVIRQMVNGGHPKFVVVYADPMTETHFSAQMLVNLGTEELRATPDNAGELEIFLYRITKMD